MKNTIQQNKKSFPTVQVVLSIFIVWLGFYKIYYPFGDSINQIAGLILTLCGLGICGIGIYNYFKIKS